MTPGKKLIRNLSLLSLVVILYAGWLVFGSNTRFEEDKKFLYIKTGSSFNDVVLNLDSNDIIRNPTIFKWISTIWKYDQKIKPGKYQINKGASLFNIVRLLRSGHQTPVNLVITKLRTKEDLAQKIGNNFECDSASVMELLNHPTKLSGIQLDSNTIMTAIIPNSYEMVWNNTAERIIKKLYGESEKFWNESRKEKSQQLHLSNTQVYILASIVEEETHKDEDKGKIASVYLNRMEKGMRLSADPTVIFALRDFSIRRVMNKHTSFESPYNTYLNAGLPPGPICTPSIKTIDAVLDAPRTDYLYFVAQPNLTGFSNFATTYEQHMQYAHIYQQWLTEYMKSKNQ